MSTRRKAVLTALAFSAVWFVADGRFPERPTAPPTRRLTGIAANDAHHNQVFVVKMVDESTVILGTLVDPDEKMQRVNALVRPSIR